MSRRKKPPRASGDLLIEHPFEKLFVLKLSHGSLAGKPDRMLPGEVLTTETISVRFPGGGAVTFSLATGRGMDAEGTEYRIALPDLERVREYVASFKATGDGLKGVSIARPV